MRYRAEWEDAGQAPDFLLGHSLGEITAAVVAGVLTEEDACRLVAARGALMDALPEGGAMVSVELGEAELRPYLSPTVQLAAVNGPRQGVLTGDAEALRRVVSSLGSTRHRWLSVSHAFHSPVLASLALALAGERSKSFAAALTPALTPTVLCRAHHARTESSCSTPSTPGM